MDLERAQQTIQIVKTINKEIENEYRELFIAADTFKNKLLLEKKQLPYHINIIDELHINENGHSRILIQLLKFQNIKGEYEFLESLVQYIQQRRHSPEFEKIIIDKPHFTQEEARIDLWVRDKGYAIIFENKIYNATDQEEQLARYIDKTKECGYSENTIFVVFLSQSGDEPAIQSWGNYKETFKQRYVNLSFRDDILLWLRYNILPNIRQKDLLLYSAVLQYIDYLEGLFYLRTIEKQMNMNLDNFIINQLELKGKTDKECVGILQEKINDFDEIAGKMESLLQTYRKNIVKEWQQETMQRFPDLEPNMKNYDTDITIHQSNGKDILILISSENNGRLYCQVQYDTNCPQEERIIADTPIMALSDLLPQRNKYCVWKYVGTDYDAVYKLFVDVVERSKSIFCNLPK